MGIRSTLLAVVLASVMCLSGCVSFSTGTPLYDRATETVVDPSLIGVWGNEEMRLTIDLAPNHGMGTRWEHFDSQPQELSEPPALQPTDFVPFGNYLYMFPTSEQQDCTTTEFGWFFVRVHRETDELEISMLNPFGLQARLYDEPHLLAHHCQSMDHSMLVDRHGFPRNQHMVVTASSADLRSFLIEHEHDPELFMYLPPLRRER